jgi:hypothetical protein
MIHKKKYEKLNYFIVVISLVSFTQAQHTGIVPVHRALSGDTIYDGDTMHHSPLSFVLLALT